MNGRSVGKGKGVVEFFGRFLGKLFDGLVCLVGGRRGGRGEGGEDMRW